MVARDQYGTGELGLHSGECERQDGVHFGGTGIAVAELIDPDTRRRPAVHRRPAGRGRLHLDPPRGQPAAADALARPDAGLHRAVRLRPDELPVPDPRPVGRHVHRQGRQRLPAVDPGGPARASPRGSPANSRSSSTARRRSTTRSRSRSRSPRDVPAARARRRSPREVAARIQAELNFSAAVTLVEPGTIASEGKTRRVIRTLSRGGRASGHRRSRDLGRRGDRHARSTREAQCHQRRDPRRAAGRRSTPIAPERDASAPPC